MGNLGGIGDLAPFLLQGYTKGTLGQEQFRQQEEERRRREAMQQQELALKFMALGEEAAGRQDTARYRGEELALKREEGEANRKVREEIAGMTSEDKELNLLLNAFKDERFSYLSPEQKGEFLQTYAELVLRRQRRRGTPEGKERVPFPGSVARDPETGALNVKPPELQHSPRLEAQIKRDTAYTGLAGAQTDLARAQAGTIRTDDERLQAALDEQIRQFNLTFQRDEARRKGDQTLQWFNATTARMRAQADTQLTLSQAAKIKQEMAQAEGWLTPQLRFELDKLKPAAFAEVRTAAGRIMWSQELGAVNARRRYFEILRLAGEAAATSLGGGTPAPGAGSPEPGASLAPAAPGAAGQPQGPGLGQRALSLANQLMALTPNVSLDQLQPFAMALRQFAQMLPQGALGAYNTFLGQALQIIDGRLDMGPQAQAARQAVARILKDLAARAGEQAPSPIGLFGNAKFIASGPPVGRQAPRQGNSGPRGQDARSVWAELAGPAIGPPTGRVRGDYTGAPLPFSSSAPPAGRTTPGKPTPTAKTTPKPTVTERERYPGKPQGITDGMIDDLKAWIRSGTIHQIMRDNPPSEPGGKQLRILYRFLKGKAYDPMTAPGRRTAPAGGR